MSLKGITKANPIWTRESIREALLYFEAVYGRAPSATDINTAPSQPRRRDAPPVEEIKGNFPALSVVIREFGSWNAAMKSCGFEQRAQGHPRREAA